MATDPAGTSLLCPPKDKGSRSRSSSISSSLSTVPSPTKENSPERYASLAERLPRNREIRTHLKLLLAFHGLRQTIENISGLFGYHGNQDTVKEKRWAVFVMKAVFRFTKYWESISGSRYGKYRGPLTAHNMKERGYTDLEQKQQPDDELDFGQAGVTGIPLVYKLDNLPPLDVVMVWHAYLLNPRRFLEDCLRYGKNDFWRTGLPLDALDAAIDDKTLVYSLSPAAASEFSNRTGIPVDNLKMAEKAELGCPKCRRMVAVPWTVPELDTGYADASFSAVHSPVDCGGTVTIDTLARASFVHAIERLITGDNQVLPATVLDNLGLPPSLELKASPWNTANWLFTRIGQEIVDKNSKGEFEGMESIRRFVSDKTTRDKAVKNDLRHYTYASIGAHSKLGYFANSSIRKTMSRFWYNTSPFSIELGGAVIRQGAFVKQMADMNWLHSPVVDDILERATFKYRHFFTLLREKPDNVVVPTLAVDAVWHTHMLLPGRYWEYSKGLCEKYVGHDDAIEMGALGNAWIWTCKAYQKRFGVAYTECNCPYCEATRSRCISTVRRIFDSKSAVERLLPSEADPGGHISAHPAILQIGDKTALKHRRDIERGLETASKIKKKKDTEHSQVSKDTHHTQIDPLQPNKLPVEFFYASQPPAMPMPYSKEEENELSKLRNKSESDFTALAELMQNVLTLVCDSNNYPMDPGSGNSSTMNSCAANTCAASSNCGGGCGSGGCGGGGGGCGGGGGGGGCGGGGSSGGCGGGGSSG